MLYFRTEPDPVKKLFLLFWCLFALPLLASHIVGGEFELLHVSGTTYRLNLIIYFDKINGLEGAKDQVVSANIFRKSDDLLMKTVILNLDTENSVGYTQPECSNGEIQTDKLTYTELIELPAKDFSDPGGYYISWERCCRNYTISNIFSQDPNVSGNTGAGQTFYLEFPPVTKNGAAFINSSPHLFPPLNDYACPGRAYYVDFAGVDDDGDSLVYSLTDPLSTHTWEALPPVLPRPYPPVLWKPGYGVNTILKGGPDLRISKDGLLRGTPGSQGLFVFAVKVEEYRSKQKIGESRRDFQMLVVDACPQSDPPQIVGKKLTDGSFTYDNTMSVSFANTVSNENRCIQVRISDPDSNKPESGFSENIKIRVVGLNFKDPDLNTILPAEVSATLTNGSTKDFRICFPACPFLLGTPYQVGIIAMDDACSLPMLDTLKVTVNVEPPPNADPYYVTPTAKVTAQLFEGTQGTWDFEARDDDGDEMTLSVVTDGFTIEDAGMRINIISQENGLIRGQLIWDAFCDVYNFAQRTSFNVKILADDNDQCNINKPAVAEYDLSVILPNNADPTVYTDLAPPSLEKIEGLERKINQSFSFDVTGSDLADNDKVSLIIVKTAEFDPFAYGVSFSDKTNVGLVQSPFQWDLRCNKIDLAKKDIFNFIFVAIDSTNKCRIRKTDTVRVEVKILPPDNTGPRLSVTNKNPEVIFSSNEVEAIRGHQINLSLEGTDPDYFPQMDSLTLELADTKDYPVPPGTGFTSAWGYGSVSSTFSWNPDCSIFQDGIYENNYSLLFYLKDNKCLNAKKDSTIVKIKVKDIDAKEEVFLPPNVFTPNGDNRNDYYAMEIRDEVTGELVNILPIDNCAGYFERVRIFNRWGTSVFESTDRDFRWLGKDEAAGVYYYYIKYSNRDYKGSVSLRY